MKPFNFLLWVEKRLLPLLCLVLILIINAVPVFATDPFTAVIGMAAGGVNIPFVPGMTPQAFGNQVADPYTDMDTLGEYPDVRIYKSTKTHDGVSYSTVKLQGTVYDQVQTLVNSQITLKGITASTTNTYNVSSQSYAGLPLMVRNEGISPSTNVFYSLPNAGYQATEFQIGYFHISIYKEAEATDWTIVLSSPTNTNTYSSRGNPGWAYTAFAVSLLYDGTQRQYYFQLDMQKTYNGTNGYLNARGGSVADLSHFVNLDTETITYSTDSEIGLDEDDMAIEVSVPTSLLVGIDSGTYTDPVDIAGILSAILPSLEDDQYIDVAVVDPGVEPTPEPSPPPVPDPNTIGGAPVSDLWNQINLIKGKQDNTKDSIDEIPPLIDITNDHLNDMESELEDIGDDIGGLKDNSGDIKDTLDLIPPLLEDGNDSLDDININIQEGNETLDDIKLVNDDILESVEGSKGILQTISGKLSDVISGIRQGVLDIVDAIEGVLEGILEAIEEGPIQLFRTALGAIKSVFGTLLGRLAGILGIWHYVVEWYNSISTPFLFFFNSARTISYNLILPVYACIAGGIVIAVYKRFGR